MANGIWLMGATPAFLPSSLCHQPLAISHLSANKLAISHDELKTSHDNHQARSSIEPGMRYLISVLLALQAVSGRAQTTDIRGTWTAELRDAKVFLQLRTAPPAEWNGDRLNGDWNMGQTFPVEAFGGLPANDPQFSVSAIKFDLRREAGSFAFDGAFRDGRGAGLFTFLPRPEYTAEMKALGYTDDLPLWRRFQLAAHDVGPKYIRELKAEGFDKLPLDQIQRAKTHGVSIEYIRDLKAQ